MIQMKERYKVVINVAIINLLINSISANEREYFSNMTPQTKELNEQVWGNLEDETRRLAKLYCHVESMVR